MTRPLYANLALARRLERVDALHLADYARGFARLFPDSGAEVLEVAGGIASFSRVDVPINRATALGMEGPVSEAELRRVEDFYRGHGVGPAVELCPLAHPSLMELLAARGYRARRFLQVGFLPLGPEALKQPSPPPGFEVSSAGEDEVETWVRTIAAGIGERDDEPPDSISSTVARVASRFEGVRLYLARLEGEVVAAAGLRVRDGVATVFSAATRVAFRGRGAQTALIQARLRDALALGCDLALVITSPEGGSMANEARAGFRVGYTRVLMDLER
ncbi:GNAT family N-acetyltransferase [Melittangium boletus]|uniref:N-acetyltransferase domain-containing protein n=1 Tax=Melittangium boletus DSM 14713 TaxID=1294270 RepID=A0A250IBU0_9BACT|nr:GNAT family N-acetyltransferase [Melittangium boletus]ATB28607.1 hypothetical protein MEBOL_002056 [Melittangium boletus DSM 14713]